MNSCVLNGFFAASGGVYRTKDGRDLFRFRILRRLRGFDIYCFDHPPLNGRDSDVNKTHLWPSRKICFVRGREPRSQSEAVHRATEWAEYFQNYVRTGVCRN